MTVDAMRGHVVLDALQDDWFQDVFLDDIGEELRRGVAWESSSDAENAARWVLTGRDVYVLAGHPDLNGWISRARITLGVEHVVLCTPERLDDVRQVLQQAGGPTPELVDESMGVPKKWIALRGIIPEHALPPGSENDILNILRPTAETEISLDGGIRLEYSTWLAGFPPHITAHGDPSRTQRVLIDGNNAARTNDGGFTAPGWDTVGTHTAWCDGAARSYTIREAAESWEPWDAYEFVIAGRSWACCGALIREHREQSPEHRTIIVPNTNPVILGATPGAVITAQPRADVYGAPCVIDPPFPPVWALPASPLLANKKTARMLLIGSPTPPSALPLRVQPRRRRALAWWSSMILDASRKHLATNPDTVAARALWRAYVQHAREVRRLLQ